MTSVRETSSKW